MKKLRIVLDTNVVVSAAIKPAGLEGLIVELVISRELVLFVSAELIAEYEMVFGRPKFARINPARMGRLLQLLKDQATMVTPRDIVTESKDEPDNRFLECAEEADADYLVTGNKRHFPKSWKSTRIVNSREFIQVVQEQAALEK
jgi:putative PIN family toxin of toxin-antitoxin system